MKNDEYDCSLNTTRRTCLHKFTVIKCSCVVRYRIIRDDAKVSINWSSLEGGHFEYVT